MTLPTILREVLKLLADMRAVARSSGGYDHVTIARSDAHSYQVRFTPDRDIPRGYRVEGRRWMDGTERTPTSGTEKAYVGWARWSAFMGFGIDAVIAADWKVL